MKNNYNKNDNAFDDLFSNPYINFERICKIQCCVDIVFCKNLCHKHYYKNNRRKNKNRKCQKCDKNVWKGKFCYSHYKEKDHEKKCKFSNECTEKQFKDGLCFMHLNESLPKCIKENCSDPIYTRKSQLCMKHYQQKRREQNKKEAIDLLIDSNVQTPINQKD